MRKHVGLAVMVGVLALGLSGSLAWAANYLAVDISFSFMVNDKEMPAGHYEIRPEGNNESALKIQSYKGGNIIVPVIERLADTGAKEPKVVFDKTDDGKSYLSEIHIPGQDGFLVGISKGREKHIVVTGKE